MRRLSNIPLRDFRKALSALGLKCVRTRGGHEAWGKPGMTRPVILQTHKDPVLEHVAASALRDLGISREDFFRILDSI